MLPPRANPHLFGHEAATAAFARAAASGRLPHAWLLVGNPGIGKATLAFALARRVLAAAPAADAAADPASALFRRVAHGSEPDLFVLERTPHPRTGRMRHEITVDQVRAVTHGLHETALGSAGRAVIVDAVDELNSEAANAFLKLLEEPPAGVVLFLVCHAPGRVPRTLISRCVRLNLAPLDATAMRRALAANGFAAAPTAAQLALAKGSPGRLARLEAAGFGEHYAALLETLAAATTERRRLAEASERLVGLAGAADAATAAELLATAVRRRAEWQGRGTLEPELFAGERRQLEALGRGVALDRWLALWDKLARLPFELDQLNVDPRHAFYLLVAELAGLGRDHHGG